MKCLWRQVALEQYQSGQFDLRVIVRAIYERFDIEWCADGEDPEDVVAAWIRHRYFVNRNGHQLVAPIQVD